MKLRIRFFFKCCFINHYFIIIIVQNCCIHLVTLLLNNDTTLFIEQLSLNTVHNHGTMLMPIWRYQKSISLRFKGISSPSTAFFTNKSFVNPLVTLSYCIEGIVSGRPTYATNIPRSEHANNISTQLEPEIRPCKSGKGFYFCVEFPFHGFAISAIR